MKKEILEIINKAKKTGWVMEPYAKEILQLYGLKTTKFHWVRTSDDLLKNAKQIKYPLVMKVVSKSIIHKTESGGVSVGIDNDERLLNDYNRIASLPDFDGVIIEEMIKGSELIIGSKQDPQFGTVILTGIGGTSVEIYKDVVIRLAPMNKDKAAQGLRSLKAVELLNGYRGADPINFDKLTDLISKFSKLAYELSEHISSIDCNPVFCNSIDAVIADARFILKE